MKQPFEIFELVRNATGFTPVQLKSQQRSEPLVKARALYSQIARAEGYTFTQIGMHLNKDHSTICNHMKMRTNVDNVLSVENLLAT